MAPVDKVHVANVEPASVKEIGSAMVTAYCLSCRYRASARSGAVVFDHLQAHQAYAATHVEGHT